ncbi:MAG: penicillin acylase family protein [Opitutales bacterium]|nr:penicillin acylase family protein [Opitutales bacterium]
MRKRIRWKRLFAAALAGLLCLALLAVLAGYAVVRQSLPRLDGEARLDGLSAPVSVERDALGVVTLRAENRLDLARATGYAHGQDRFFAMDLQRRAGTGELAALLGAFAVEADMERRLHGGPSLVSAAFERLDPWEARLLEAYAAGVNAGLASLRVRPPEYIALRQRPAPWRAKDTLAVGLAMYYVLQDPFGYGQQQREALREHFPESVVDFMLYAPGFDDAPLDGTPPAPPPFPAEAWAAALEAFEGPVDNGLSDRRFSAREDVFPGSNAWVVGPARTRSGRALLAGDPHLGIGLPIIWYRVAMHYKDEAGDAVDLYGVTVPGAPFLIAGSNTRVAWSPTNSYARLTDLVRLDLDPDDPSRYHDGSGYRSFAVREERIDIRGTADPVTHRVKTTKWGPVWTEPAAVGEADDEPPPPAFAIRWMGASPHGLGAGLHRVESADSVEAVLGAAALAGIPTQNLIAADEAGNIGWTLLGPLPRREAAGGNRFALSPEEAAAVWNGVLAAGEYPRILNPPAAALWSANHQKLPGTAGAALGDGGFARDGRAGRIRDRLLADSAHDESSMLDIQLDAQAEFYAEFRDFLVALIDGGAGDADPILTMVRDALAAWDETASAGSIGFRILTTWYSRFRAETKPRLFAPVAAAAPAAAAYIELPGKHAAFREIILNRPQGLLPRGEDSWDALHLRILGEIADDLTDRRGNWSAATWGDFNLVRATHPFSAMMPFLSRWMDMPAEPMSGSPYSPRVHWRTFGQSYRMAISPGREDEAIFTMPGGNSGHPLSPFYDAGHAEWARGEPLPLLPGNPRHTLRLAPEGGNGG